MVPARACALLHCWFSAADPRPRRTILSHPHHALCCKWCCMQQAVGVSSHVVMKRTLIEGSWAADKGGKEQEDGGDGGSGRWSRTQGSRKGGGQGVSDGGCLVAAVHGASITLDSCTVRWLADAHSTPLIGGLHETLVHGSLNGKVRLSRTELLVDAKALSGPVPSGISVGNGASAVVSRSLLRGCSAAAMQQGSIMASHMVVQAKGSRLRSSAAAGQAGKREAQGSSSSRTISGSSSRAGAVRERAEGSEDGDSEGGHGQGCVHSSLLTTGLALSGGGTARLTSCIVQGFGVATEVGALVTWGCCCHSLDPIPSWPAAA